MKVALIGATGNVGSRLLAELIHRGHEVTGIARHPERLPVDGKVSPHRGDIAVPAELAKALAGHDAVIHAVRFQSSVARNVLSTVKRSGVRRLLVVGGAGSLQTPSGAMLVDTPQFPEAYKPEALAGRDFLNVLTNETDLDWTFLCPSALLTPGERTGRFRLGTDQLLVGSDGTSGISMEDFAVAMVDELERPQHTRCRFTVGY